LPVGYAVLGLVGSGVVGFTIATLLYLALAWIANSAIEKPMRKGRSLIRGRAISPVSSQAMIIQPPIQAKAISNYTNS
jgi:peptidoglycan/LPS O-acetylase OafA/YrhL